MKQTRNKEIAGEMKENTSKPFSLAKHNTSNSNFLKLVVLLFLLGLTIRLLPSHYIESTYATLSTTDKAAAASSTELAKCDLFKGDWIPNQSSSVYNYTCPFIVDPQNCMKNGRPDSAYLNWRWSPKDCDLPKFNPKKFLHLMEHKSWAFIGDSISRNHVQSLLCILSQIETPNEIYHDEQYKSRTWNFPSYNFTVAVIWTPFLIKADVFEDDNGVSTSETRLHLDHLDEKWTSRYKDFNYVTIAGGKWFLKTAIYYENSKVQGCHYCQGKNDLAELGFDHAYRKTIKLVFDFVKSSSHKPVVFFRTITPDHFENGEWHNGGTCPRKVPFKEHQVNVTYADSVLYKIELEEFDKAMSSVGSRSGLGLKLLNKTHLSLLRPDGHAGPYRQLDPFANGKNAKVQNDCLHWCLPGPIDYWNDLIMEILMSN